MTTHHEEAIQTIRAAIWQNRNRDALNQPKPVDQMRGHRDGRQAHKDAKAALRADPLRQKLGEAAIAAIMEGKAAVVPLEQEGLMLHVISYSRINADGSRESLPLPLGLARFDKPTAEKGTAV
ncbi:hypothetical protein [Tautonia plasticadhaerens]|uniref:Uncharacterized protein n=1 Tax=Tautonia plasticadhaerens TaxID=2527974 RepID=A0A518H2C1_9BACT|nr:hypothetical protein [Tautonia plasticadhaerens]QDV34960.1 hypothetical protein ElP_28570 [Tautonia plasticadhaerens]